MQESDFRVVTDGEKFRVEQYDEPSWLEKLFGYSGWGKALTAPRVNCRPGNILTFHSVKEAQREIRFQVAKAERENYGWQPVEDTSPSPKF